MTIVGKYRKKPVEVEAIQWRPYEMLLKDVMDFMGVTGDMAKEGILSIGKDRVHLIIRTLEGDMTVSDGDYIIKGIKGEFYPCKPDIFEATYEAVGDQ